MIGNNEEMKEEMDRVMAENSVISKRLLEFSLKLPLIQQGSMSVVEPPEGLYAATWRVSKSACVDPVGNGV